MCPLRYQRSAGFAGCDAEIGENRSKTAGEYAFTPACTDARNCNDDARHGGMPGVARSSW